MRDFVERSGGLQSGLTRVEQTAAADLSRLCAPVGQLSFDEFRQVDAVRRLVLSR